MPLAFVLDEHLGGVLSRVIRAHNAKGLYPIDAVRVGGLPDLPVASPDPEMLAWAERAGRIFVSCDYSTMTGHLATHGAAGQTSPGVLFLRPNIPWPEAVEFLALIAHAGRPEDYADRYQFFP